MSTNKEILDSLYKATLEGLLVKVRGPDATAADFQAARQFLKDNGITSIPEASPALLKLAESIPFPVGSDVEEAV